MIGLFGIYHREPETPADLSSMAASVPSDYVVDGPAGRGAALGRVIHRHDNQRNRRSSPNGRLTVAAMGEIFNAGELTGAGADEPAADVAAVVLALMEAGRLDRLADANGLFCASAYDRADHRLTLITDRLASFPIHVWHADGEAVFAGQIHTLLGDRRIARKAHPEALAQLFTMQRTVGTITSVAGAEALPAGCIRQIDGNRHQERRYWRLSWRRPDFGRREGAERLAGAFRRALRRQTQARRAGLLLSGGIDSRLLLAASPRGSLSCWTTASYEDNPELRVARTIAERLGAKHHALIVPPAETLDVLERTVIESNGLYPASTPMSAFLPAVGSACDTILAGHGLDYTLRGYYLPARFVTIGGSSTRLPSLRPIPRHPTGGDVLANLRQGPPRQTVDRIVAPARRKEWWTLQAKALDDVLAPWLQSEEPYNAWDAFILHAVSKHYAYTGMMSTRAVGALRLPAFDNEVFDDIYLGMPPAWRCNGGLVLDALRLISTDAARLPNANTHFRADLGPWREIGALLGRAGLRRLGLARRPSAPSAAHSTGSWQNLHALYRDEPAHRARFLEIRDRLDGLSFGILDPNGLAACIDEHLAGRASHGKLLRQLLTHDAWVRTFGISGHA